MSLNNILNRLNERDLAVYLRTLDDFQSSCKFEVIKDSYNDLVDAFDKYLASVQEPVKVRNRLNPFFDMLELTDNPANDQRILRKYQEESADSSTDDSVDDTDASSHSTIIASKRDSILVQKTVEEPDIAYFRVPTQSRSMSVYEAIATHLQQQNISEATRKGYRAMIATYVVTCQDKQWDFNGPYEEAVKVLIKYLKFRYNQGSNLTRIRSSKSGIKMFYNMMGREDENPTKDPKLKILFQDIQKQQENDKSIIKEVESDAKLSSIASENEMEQSPVLNKSQTHSLISSKTKKPALQPRRMKSNKTVLENCDFHVPTQPHATSVEDAINKFLDTLELSKSTSQFYKGSIVRYLRGCQDLGINPNAPYKSAVSGIIKYLKLRASDGASYKSLMQEKILIKKYFVMMGRENDRNPATDKRILSKLKLLEFANKKDTKTEDTDTSDEDVETDDLESDEELKELEIQYEKAKREKELWDNIYEFVANEQHDELIDAMESY